MPPARRGPDLPYRLLAGVVPCPGGWLVMSGKLQGVTLSPDEAFVAPVFIDVLDHRPGYEVVAVAAPLGLLDEAEPGGRTCDREARRLLGWPRSGAVVSPPSRAAVVSADGKGLNPVQRAMLPRAAELARDVQPYNQRSVHEVHPELSFHQLNGDRPLRWSKRLEAGIEERKELLVGKLPGAERLLDVSLKGVRPAHLLDAGAALWTSRRIMARAVQRIPEDPEWDSEGLRKEILR